MTTFRSQCTPAATGSRNLGRRSVSKYLSSFKFLLVCVCVRTHQHVHATVMCGVHRTVFRNLFFLVWVQGTELSSAGLHSKRFIS